MTAAWACRGHVRNETEKGSFGMKLRIRLRRACGVSVVVYSVGRVWVGSGFGAAVHCGSSGIGLAPVVRRFRVVPLEFVEFVTVSGFSSISIVLEPVSWVSQLIRVVVGLSHDSPQFSPEFAEFDRESLLVGCSMREKLSVVC
jgi:hypothetical protein